MTKQWKASWTANPQGPYPVGGVTVQTVLDQAFPDPERGAVNQSFRLILRPDLWGERVRIRFSNLWGKRPLVVDDAYAGLHLGSAAVLEGAAAPLRFGGDARVSIPPGESAWTDPVALPFYRDLGSRYLAGRRLAVSFHVPDESGPMTWHATAMTSSYVSWPDAGSAGDDCGEFHFPFSYNSWFFVDALEVESDPDTLVVACFGDSITDGNNSTTNGDDRWPDVFSRLAHARLGDRVSVVNAGIGGNQIVGHCEHSADTPYRGGPSALRRLDRDVLSLSGLGLILWLEGINDFHIPDRTVQSVIEGMRQAMGRIRERAPGVRVVACTLTPALGSSLPDYGTAAQDDKRRALNDFIRTTDIFDDWVEFAEAVTDPDTGRLRREFVPQSTRGGEGDGLHPNRLGKLKMVEAIDIDRILYGKR